MMIDVAAVNSNLYTGYLLVGVTIKFWPQPVRFPTEVDHSHHYSCCIGGFNIEGVQLEMSTLIYHLWSCQHYTSYKYEKSVWIVYW